MSLRRAPVTPLLPSAAPLPPLHARDLSALVARGAAVGATGAQASTDVRVVSLNDLSALLARTADVGVNGMLARAKEQAGQMYKRVKDSDIAQKVEKARSKASSSASNAWTSTTTSARRAYQKTRDRGKAFGKEALEQGIKLKGKVRHAYNNRRRSISDRRSRAGSNRSTGGYGGEGEDGQSNAGSRMSRGGIVGARDNGSEYERSRHPSPGSPKSERSSRSDNRLQRRSADEMSAARDNFSRTVVRQLKLDNKIKGDSNVKAGMVDAMKRDISRMVDETGTFADFVEKLKLSGLLPRTGFTNFFSNPLNVKAMRRAYKGISLIR